MRIRPHDDELFHLHWASRRPAPDTYGYAYFDDDMCMCMSISILTHGPLTIADAFASFGEPEVMWMHTKKAVIREWVKVTLPCSPR